MTKNLADILLSSFSAEEIKETIGVEIDTHTLAEETNSGQIENKKEDYKWEMPIPFDEKTLPTFPVNIFPDWLRSYVEGVAESTQTPIDAAAMGAIAILSTALTKKFYVRITPEWSEQLNTYSILALPPGSRKSPVFKSLQEPVATFEKEERQRVEPLISEQRATLKAKRKRVEQLEKEYAKKGQAAILEEIIALNAEIDGEQILTVPRFITGDITAEKLGVLMAENNERMAVLSAEGGGVFGNMSGRYSTDGRANIEIYLNGHTGDYTPIDRIGREPILLNEPCLTIGLFVQPEVVRGLPPAFEERGLMQRFLYSFPPSIVGYRKVNPQPIPEIVKEKYSLNIKKMMRFNVGESIQLTFDEAATAARIDMAEVLEQMFIDGERLADMKEWGSKLAGQIIRIMALLHVAEHVEHLSLEDSIPKKINEITFLKARQLINYFIEHAKEAYGIMGADEGAKDAQHLLKYLLQNGKSEYTKREAYQGTKGKFKNASRFEMAVYELEERNYIQKRGRNIKGKGRKSYDLVLNPKATIPNIPGNRNNAHTSRDKQQNKPLPINTSQFPKLNNGSESFNSGDSGIKREEFCDHFKYKNAKGLTDSENSGMRFVRGGNKDNHESELI
ncbi:MAG TPA: YfjI family protein [Chondromyces sp.]|nr:YfjI family protein [Chondromyces sp.]